MNISKSDYAFGNGQQLWGAIGKGNMGKACLQHKDSPLCIESKGSMLLIWKWEELACSGALIPINKHPYPLLPYALSQLPKVSLLLVIKIINMMSSKFHELQQSSISKYAITERKATRNHLPQSLIDKDYQLERQYLEKLKLQRVKTEKLFEEYTNTTKDLKKEKEITSRFKIQVEELRNRLAELERERAETERGRSEVRSLQAQCQQQKTQIRSLLSDKSTLIKKFKEVQLQLSSYQSLKLQHQESRMQIEDLQEQVVQARRKLKSMMKEHQEEMESLRERNLDLQKVTLQATRELKREREQREAVRGKADQQKELWQQMMRNYEEELHSYSKTVTQLQETNTYLSLRVEEKAKQTQQLKRTAEEHRQALRQGRGQLESLRTRLQEKQRKYECLQKDLSESYSSIRQKQEELVRIHKALQGAGQRHSGRIKQLQQQNAQLKRWMEEYQGVLEQRRIREIEHKELLQDELEEITKFERIFKSIE